MKFGMMCRTGARVVDSHDAILSSTTPKNDGDLLASPQADNQLKRIAPVKCLQQATTGRYARLSPYRSPSKLLYQKHHQEVVLVANWLGGDSER